MLCIARMEAKRQAIKYRAAALDAAEEQRRFQEATLGRQAEQAGGPNQDRFLQQLTGRVRSVTLLFIYSSIFLDDCQTMWGLKDTSTNKDFVHCICVSLALNCCLLCCP